MNRTARAAGVAAVLAAASAPPTLAAQDTSAVRTVPGGVVFDFQDTDIRLVITALAEAGRMNVVFGELPARRATLRLRQPVGIADIPALLRTLVQANGLLVVDAGGGLLRIDAPAVGADPARAGAGAADLRLFVHRLRHARAARLAGTLQSIFGSRGGAQSPTLGLSQPPLSDQLRRQQIAPVLPETLLTPPAAVVGIQGLVQSDVQIVPDETTNSLLIRATQADYDVVRQAIEAMDLRPLQAMIEVLVAEVRRTRDLDVKVSARVGDRRSGTTAESGSSLVSDTTSVADFLIRLSRGGRLSVDVAISALASRGDVRILSRPLVIAQNNEEAKILVGSQRPFVQVFRSLPTDAGVRDQIVQYRDVGTALTIRPTINPDGYVSLQLSQEVSSATAETQFGAPVISTREASTSLFVRDGQTAVIGGLVDRQQERTRSGVPFLSEIPVIGFLFGGVRNGTVNSELFLLLTPHIVSTDEDMDRVRRAVEERPDGISPELSRNPPVVPPAPPPVRRP